MFVPGINFRQKWLVRQSVPGIQKACRAYKKRAGHNVHVINILVRIFTRRILLPARSDCGSTMPASISLRLLSFFIIKGRAARPAARPNELPVCLNYAYVASLHVASFSLPELIADRQCLPPFLQVLGTRHTGPDSQNGLSGKPCRAYRHRAGH